MATDCHLHVFGEPDAYPLDPAHTYVPGPAPLEEYRRAVVPLGVDRAVLVQPSVYGTDNRLLLDTLRADPGDRLRGVVVTEPDVPDATLAAWHALGVRGIRVNPRFPGGVGIADLPAVAARIAGLGWHVQLILDAADLPDLREVIDRVQEHVPVVVDHMAMTADPAGQDALLDLLAGGRAWVKLSAPYLLTADPAPYAGTVPLARRLLAAAPDRAVWGTNWPHPAHDGPEPDDRALLRWLHAVAPDAAIRRAVLADNPARLYGFPERSDAVVVDAFGPPDVLAVRPVPRPVPGPGQVLVEVAYAGVNYFDVLQRRGAVPGLTPPLVPGLEVSGRIAALGPAVPGQARLAAGDEVAALTVTGTGGYAAFAVCDARLVLPLDGLVPLDQAATLPVAAVTAYHALADLTRIRAGESVLVHGAAGGVGTIAGQVARALGAGPVIGTASDPAKHDHARRHGYTHVLPRDGFADAVRELTGGRGVDVVVEMGGGDQLLASLDVLAPFGRIAYIGDPGFLTSTAVPLQQLRSATRGVLGYSVGGLAATAPETWLPAACAVRDLVAAGRVTLGVSGRHPLRDAVAAHAALESRTAVGKLVLVPDPTETDPDERNTDD